MKKNILLVLIGNRKEEAVKVQQILTGLGMFNQNTIRNS
jgi:hypothetical protein